MLLTILCAVALVFSVFPLLLFLDNIRLYRPLWKSLPPTPPSVSLLIPARNEEALIEASLTAALASVDVDLEVIVLNDHSTDLTPRSSENFPSATQE